MEKSGRSGSHAKNDEGEQGKAKRNRKRITSGRVRGMSKAPRGGDRQGGNQQMSESKECSLRSTENRCTRNGTEDNQRKKSKRGGSRKDEETRQRKRTGKSGRNRSRKQKKREIKKMKRLDKEKELAKAAEIEAENRRKEKLRR
eukprot:TRINITY_DN4693_c0_g2_i1.p1 TRINITY_DN4693_c0_g2~~TRINITY_DN4693_c0_g2_i1.p1  ORF type:complete len:144 (-),score=33.99 TRINITY_DN4693_c0_g2_i1:17-448(-)